MKNYICLFLCGILLTNFSLFSMIRDITEIYEFERGHFAMLDTLDTMQINSTDGMGLSLLRQNQNSHEITIPPSNIQTVQRRHIELPSILPFVVGLSAGSITTVLCAGGIFVATYFLV